MYRGCTVGVVVPAYNEEVHVRHVLETIPSFVDRIYPVDDRSTDRTWEEIQTAVEANEPTDPVMISEAPTPRAAIGPEAEPELASMTDGGMHDGQQIIPIRHEENQGAGAALRTGYLHALGDGIDLIVSMDADGQMDPRHLPGLLDPIVDDVADYTKGNRLAGRADRAGMPSFRLFGNWLLGQLTKMSSGYWRIDDPQNGYTAISHEALARIGIEDIPDDHNYTNDVLVRLNANELRVADVPMPAIYDDEESTIRYRTFVPRTTSTLVRGFLYRLGVRYESPFAPVPAVYAIGVLAIGIGLSTAVASLWQSGGPALLTLGTVLLGLLAVGVAALLDARANAGLEVPV